MSHDGSVWKDAPIGTSFMIVHAIDEDAGGNSKVRYSFVEANDKFEISDNGVISTKVSLKSFVETWTYEVIASNTEPMSVGAGNSESRTATISIYVTELQPPKFTKSVYTGSIDENSEPGVLKMLIAMITELLFQ